MKKIGISTVYTGYNYGSALQAYATKYILQNLGCKADLLRLSGSLLPGRDMRIKKLFAILFRSLFHANGVKNLKNYGDSISKKLPEESIALFNNFFDERLCPVFISYSSLKRAAHHGEYDVFLCGSDQVWNSAVFYVDPFYYLRFAPYEKRVAFAPSFGRDFVPNYNKKKISRFVSEFRDLSIRESSGAKIITELTGKTAEVLPDPTLAMSADEWMHALHLKETNDDKYLLAYFLDKPSAQTVEKIKTISSNLGLRIITLPYVFEASKFGPPEPCGPIEFVEFIKNATFVCTDSFHGTAFSLNFNIPFYTFERNYGNAGKQSARIESLLNMTSQFNRYNPESINSCMDISFETVNSVLSAERIKSRDFLTKVLFNEET